MAKQRIIVITVILFSLFASLYSQSTITDFDVSDADQVVFKIKSFQPGFGEYETLFLANLQDGSLRQLTFFPQSMAFLPDSSQLQIQNSYGIFQSDSNLTSFSPPVTLPSFIRDSLLLKGKSQPVVSSPDGHFMAYIRSSEPGFADISLFNTSDGAVTLIASMVDRVLSSPMVSFSPDSKFLVYGKANAIYYYSIAQMQDDRVPTENLRKIATGSIRNVAWNARNELYYLSNNIVYKISSREFFTRGLYKDSIIMGGTVLGRLPLKYNANSDSFWVSNDEKKIIICRNGSNYFLFYLSPDDYLSFSYIRSLPALYLPKNSLTSRLTWSKKNYITLLSKSINKGERLPLLFRLSALEGTSIGNFRMMDDPDVTDISLSPNEDLIALVKKDVVEVRNNIDWAKKHSIQVERPMSVLWKSDNELIISGAYFVNLYRIDKKEFSLLAFSQPGDICFSEDEKSILMDLNGTRYSCSLDDFKWKKINSFKKRTQKTKTNAYRVYLDDSESFDFNNMLMVRKTEEDAYGTTPLFKISEAGYDSLSVKEDKIDLLYFNHGSRSRRREVALVFDVVNSIEGLTFVFDVLAEYKLKCTFFVNGEAIKQNPLAVREIANSGHEVGSMFSSYFDMTDSRYLIDEDFIKNGLANSEDEYFAVTNKELSLFWHAPFYFVNSQIINASKEMGYVYVGKDVNTLDWVTESQQSLASGLYLSASEIINKIIREKKPGSIIPVMVGAPDKYRMDYLYNKIDVLIDELYNKGYDIVPVSVLYEHAK
ncbi:MAG: polysaccharide deacetylase family protein [Spirochaetales bacterium]|nr:polysaccharide deacetylase family protein [Spirochaetales bacterium]